MGVTGPTVLHSFTCRTDGGYPYAGLIRDSAGNLYGTTEVGGGDGTVFKNRRGGDGDRAAQFYQGERTGESPTQAYSGTRRAISTALPRRAAQHAMERCSSWTRPARRYCTVSPGGRTAAPHTQVWSKTRQAISTVGLRSVAPQPQANVNLVAEWCSKSLLDHPTNDRVHAPGCSQAQRRALPLGRPRPPAGAGSRKTKPAGPRFPGGVRWLPAECRSDGLAG
jgi:hypothetical protein